MVHQVLPRRNELLDPAIANVDAALMVFSLADPPFEAANATRFLVSAEAAGVPVRLLLNKADLLSPQQLHNVIAQVRSWGYEPQVVSAQSGTGLQELRAACIGKVSVVAGPSGVGKSSLLNALSSQLANDADRGHRGDCEAKLADYTGNGTSSGKTSEGTSSGASHIECPQPQDLHRSSAPSQDEAHDGIGASQSHRQAEQGSSRVQWTAFQRGAGGRGVSAPNETAIGDEIEGVQAVGSIGARGRGKHTTRTVTLLPLRSGGYVADTPGFNQPTLDNVTADTLAATFPEITGRLREHGRCRFANCRHKHEPGCVVRGDWERYPFYLQLLDEVVAKDERERERSISKKTRQGNVRTKTVAGGGTAIEALLDSKKHRKPSRRRGNQSMRQQMDSELDEEYDGY